MSTPSPPYCRLDLVPPLADRFIFGVAPIDYGPLLLLMPSGSHLAVDTLPSGESELPPANEAVNPAFGYDAPHPSVRGTSTLLNNALLSAHCRPLRHPKMPGPSLAGDRLPILRHTSGLPVLRTSSWCTCCRQYPGTATEFLFARSLSRISLPRKQRRVDLCIFRFEVCSAFTRVTARTLATSPKS